MVDAWDPPIQQVNLHDPQVHHRGADVESKKSTTPVRQAAEAPLST